MGNVRPVEFTRRGDERNGRRASRRERRIEGMSANFQLFIALILATMVCGLSAIVAFQMEYSRTAAALAAAAWMLATAALAVLVTVVA